MSGDTEIKKKRIIIVTKETNSQWTKQTFKQK